MLRRVLVESISRNRDTTEGCISRSASGVRHRYGVAVGGAEVGLGILRQIKLGMMRFEGTTRVADVIVVQLIMMMTRRLRRHHVA